MPKQDVRGLAFGRLPIGVRPVDLPSERLLPPWAQKITTDHGFVEAKADKAARGKKSTLDFPSVGATENLIMAAALAEGQTIIENAATEPEIVDLADF